MIKKIAIAIIMLFISTPAFAIAGVELAADDEALFYMRVIFGDAVMFLANGQIPDSQEFDSVLGQLAYTFNLSMTLLNQILVIVVFFMAFFDTAHKGKIDKEKYDTVWLPVRILLSLMIVTPISGGYNSLQMGVFYVAGAGIQTANKLTQASIEYMNKKGTVINLTYGKDIERLSINLLQSWVCTEAYNKIMDEQVITLEPKVKRTAYLDASVQISGYGYSDEPFSYPCGTYDVTANEIITVYDEVASAKNEYKLALISMVENLNDQLRPIAVAIVDNAEIGGVPSTQTPNQQAFALAITQAQESMDIASEKLVADIFQNSEEKEWSQETKNIIKNGNFINLGALYWTWTTITQKVLDVHKSITIQATSGITQKIYDEREMELAFTSLAKYINEDRFITLNSGQVKASEFPAKYKPVISDAPVEEKMQAEIDDLNYKQEEYKNELSDGVIGAFGPLIEPTNDPLTTIVITGQRFINLAEAALLVNAAVNVLALDAQDTKDALDSWIPGSGLITTGIKFLINFLIEALKLLAAAALAILLAAATLGFMAAIYIPAIPIIQWVVGVFNYFAFLIELVIIAPVHAVAHALPEGRGVAGQHAKTGYMLILGLFLGPPLMVFGFYAAITLCNVGGMILISMWSPFFESSLAGPNGTMGMFISSYIILPFGLGFVFLSAFIALVQRSFQLINELRDKSLRMIGGGSENFGDGSQMERMGSQMALAGGVIAAGTHSFSKGPQLPNQDDGYNSEEQIRNQGQSGGNESNDSVASREVK